MANYRVQDRSGSVLEVSGKEQADYWVGLGYTLLEEDAKPAARKAATKKTASKPSKS